MHWNKRNPEKMREAAARYRARHPDRVKAARKKYAEDKSDRVLELREKYKPKKRAYEKKRREDNPERIAEINARYNRKPEAKAKAVLRAKAQRKKFPEKVRARKTANYHASTGAIAVAKCAVCGATENLEMHHEDYSKPKEVTVLCEKCHKKLHKEIRHGENISGHTEDGEGNLPDTLGVRP